MLITEKQLAERWGYSPATLRKWRIEGRGPDFLKIGFGVRYSIETIEAEEEKNLRRSTSDDGED